MTYRQGANRRKSPRRDTGMAVDIVQRRRWGGWRRMEVSARGLDYSRFGMAFVSRRRLRPGQTLRLNLHGPAMVLRRVEAHVVSSARLGRGYRVSVRFYRSLRALTETTSVTPEMRYLSGLEEQL